MSDDLIDCPVCDGLGYIPCDDGSEIQCTPRRRHPSNQESVRSTTHRCRPSRSEESIPRRAMRGVMPRDRRARRRAEAS